MERRKRVEKTKANGEETGAYIAKEDNNSDDDDLDDSIANYCDPEYSSASSSSESNNGATINWLGRSPKPVHKCRFYHNIFDSDSDSSTALSIINSTVDSSMDIGTADGFRGWHYVTAAISLAEDIEADSGYLVVDASGLTSRDKS
ncbi:hypothetical protein MMC22_001636 [Lobaria immixta]|nr:hypothetical protein [Lobaria immixta]